MYMYLNTMKYNGKKRILNLTIKNLVNYLGNLHFGRTSITVKQRCVHYVKHW